MNTSIRFIMAAALIVSAFVATPAAASYQTPIDLDNTGPGNTAQSQVLVQIDTASLRAGGVIASDSCADVAFYDGATRLNHWFETTCPGPSGGVTNVWIETALAAGATKTVTMVSGSGSTGNETPWGGNFILANGADNCPADWTLQSAMAGYFPLPGAASWGATQAGGHSHQINVSNEWWGDSAYCTAGSDHVLASNDHYHTVQLPTDSMVADEGLPPYVDVPFCGKGKLDIRANMLGLFAALPGGVAGETAQYGRFWRGSAGSYGGVGGQDTHAHHAAGQTGSSEGLVSSCNPGDVTPYAIGNHFHDIEITTPPASSLPRYLDLVPGRLSDGFAADAAPLLVFADQAPPLGWQSYAAADDRYLRLNGTAGGEGDGLHTHPLLLINSNGGTFQNPDATVVIRKGYGFIMAASSTGENATPETENHGNYIQGAPPGVDQQANRPPSFGVQLYQRLPQTGISVTVAPAALPWAPAIGTATPADSSVSVTFTAPSDDGGAAIDLYRATCTGGFSATGAGSPITVSGLSNGSAYTCTVAAHNPAGWGDESAASNSATPKGNQSIDFANPGPQDFGTSPTLSATASSGLAVTFTSSTTAVCTVTAGGSLTFITTGTCAIDADQAGDGSYAAAPTVSQSFMVNAVAPGAPGNATAAAVDSSAVVAFTPPASNGGATIDSYRATCTGGITATGDESPITVSGLTNGSAYTCTVAAHNPAGWSDESAASNSVTPSATPEFFVTPGATGGGTISPSVPQVVTQGSTTAFTITPESEHTAEVGGTCGGSLSGNTYTTSPITADCSVIATFTLNTYSLTISKTGKGTVTSIPEAITCGADCSAEYDFGTEVTLTATPEAGGTFIGWSGGGCAGDGVCTVTMDAQKEISATFSNPFPWTMFLPALTKGE